MTADELLRRVVGEDLSQRADVCRCLAAALDRPSGPAPGDLDALSTADLRAVIDRLSLYRLLTERPALVKQLAHGELNRLVERLTQIAQAAYAPLPARLLH